MNTRALSSAVAWISLLLTAMTLSGCSQTASSPGNSFASASTAGNAPALHTIELQQEWFPYSGFAGEVSGARRFATHNGIQLKVLPGSEQIDPIKLVLSGVAPFGVAGGDLLVDAISKGAPLVVIGVVNEHTPTVFLVPADSDIHSPKEFPGHRIGVLPGTNTERVYELMLKNAGIDRLTLHEVPIPFDLQTYILKQYEVRPAFAYDEPVSLEQKGFPYREIKPADFGVVFTGTVYFTTRENLAARRSDAVNLMKTLIEGWQFALADPADSIADLARSFPPIDRKREFRALQLGADYFRGENGEPLRSNPEIWNAMIQGLEQVGAIPRDSVHVDRVWDPSVVNEAYSALAVERGLQSQQASAAQYGFVLHHPPAMDPRP